MTPKVCLPSRAPAHSQPVTESAADPGRGGLRPRARRRVGAAAQRHESGGQTGLGRHHDNLGILRARHEDQRDALNGDIKADWAQFKVIRLAGQDQAHSRPNRFGRMGPARAYRLRIQPPRPRRLWGGASFVTLTRVWALFRERLALSRGEREAKTDGRRMSVWRVPCQIGAGFAPMARGLVIQATHHLGEEPSTSDERTIVTSSLGRQSRGAGVQLGFSLQLLPIWVMLSGAATIRWERVDVF